MRYLTLGEVLYLHARLVATSGGAVGLARLGGLEAALALPRQTFAEGELYPTLAAKAAILGFALIQNHPFVDGNKRVGHAAMVTFLALNGHRLQASVDEAEAAILGVASSQWPQSRWTDWVEAQLRPIDSPESLSNRGHR